MKNTSHKKKKKKKNCEIYNFQSFSDFKYFERVCYCTMQETWHNDIGKQNIRKQRFINRPLRKELGTRRLQT